MSRVGSGPGFVVPYGIQTQMSGSASYEVVVLDFGLNAVILVDSKSGDRKILSSDRCVGVNVLTACGL